MADGTPQTEATLDTVVDGMPGADEYVRRILQTMRISGFDQVRIGITSGSEPPDYIFDEFFKDADDQGSGQPVPMAAYSGKTHRPLSFARADKSENWSSVGMSMMEVRQFRGRIRGWTPKPKPARSS